MGLLIDLTGKRYGRLVVLGIAERRSGQTMWKCQCDCGNIVITYGREIKKGNILSCGCYRKERIKLANTKHDKYNTRLYRIWKGIKERCLNKNSKHYFRYGLRGISICEEWRNDFKAFYDWAMANAYADNLTIDRIDVNGNYEPSNCRWATMKEQSNNRRNNHYIEFNGEKHSLKEWSEIIKIPYSKIKRHVYAGENINLILSEVDNGNI